MEGGWMTGVEICGLEHEVWNKQTGIINIGGGSVLTFFHAHDLAIRPGRKANLWHVTNDYTYLLT